MPTKAQTENKLQLAMDRLLNSAATKTDGRLTLSNVAKEAGVSRATVYRATAFCEDFNNHSQQKQAVHERILGYAERVRELEQQVAQTIQTKNKIIQDLQQSVEILAQQVQALTLENEELQAAVRQPGSNITPLH